MGKKDKNKKKGKGLEKTTMKTEKKSAAKQKKLLAKIGEADIEDVISKLEVEESRLKEVIETVCPPPTPRSNFSLCSHPDKEELILFGGELYDGQKVFVYNDLYFYNISKNEWKLLKSPGGPTPRSGHQMVSVANEGGQLWLFGGEHASPSQLQFYHYKDLWVLRFATKKWEKINSPNGPSPRSGHRMTAIKKKLVVFGGFYDNNRSYQYYNDVHMFSLETYTWLKIDVSGAIIPPPRSGCCVAPTQDGKIFIWGGYSKTPVKKEVDKGITHTDMYALVPDKFNNTKFKWTTMKAGGIRPTPRSSVGFALSANNKIYCFGGVMDIEEDEENLRGQFGNELYCLDLTSTAWRLLQVNKKEKKQKDEKDKHKESMEIEEDNVTTFTTDGIFTVSVGKPTASSSQQSKSSSMDSLSAIKPLKTGPSPRMNAGLTICKGNLYVYGGIYEENNKQYTLNDLYSLDLHKLDEWKTIIASNFNSHNWFDSDSEGSSSDSSEDDAEDDDDGDDDDDDDSGSSEMDTD